MKVHYDFGRARKNPYVGDKSRTLRIVLGTILLLAFMAGMVWLDYGPVARWKTDLVHRWFGG